MASPFVDKLDKDSGRVGKVVGDKLAELREGTSRIIAIVFVSGYFFFLFAILFIGFRLKWPVEDYKEMFISTTAILSSPLSFILGYFFKSVSETKSS